MKLLQERFNVLISVLISVLVFAFIISNFPIKTENESIQNPVVHMNSQTDSQFEKVKTKTQSLITGDDTQVWNPLEDTGVHNGQE